MSRQKRRIIENATYHTRSRCIEKKLLMKPKRIKELMHGVLNMSLNKYSFELVGYTIMDNHFHFYITVVNGGENISRIMQFIKSRFAQGYNRMMGRIGPFWNERFSDIIIDLHSEPQVLFHHILWHIGYNPVRSKNVKDPRDYKFSSIRCYLEEDFVPPVRITLHKYFLQLGTTFHDRVKKLLEYEEIYIKRTFPDCIFE